MFGHLQQNVEIELSWLWILAVVLSKDFVILGLTEKDKDDALVPELFESSLLLK